MFNEPSLEPWMKERALQTHRCEGMSKFVQSEEKTRVNRLANVRSKISQNFQHDNWTKRKMDDRLKRLRKDRKKRERMEQRIADGEKKGIEVFVGPTTAVSQSGLRLRKPANDVKYNKLSLRRQNGGNVIKLKETNRVPPAHNPTKPCHKQKGKKHQIPRNKQNYVSIREMSRVKEAVDFLVSDDEVEEVTKYDEELEFISVEESKSPVSECIAIPSLELDSKSLIDKAALETNSSYVALDPSQFEENEEVFPTKASSNISRHKKELSPATHHSYLGDSSRSDYGDSSFESFQEED